MAVNAGRERRRAPRAPGCRSRARARRTRRTQMSRSASATRKKIVADANQTSADREREQNGAAQDASHFAPSATGDGLMPP